MDAEKTSVIMNFGDRVVGEMDLPLIDMTQYIGREVRIARYEERKGQHGYFVIVYTEPVDFTVGGHEITATKILSLLEDANSKLGWGKDSFTGQYLHKMGVLHYKDLVGKMVKVQTRISKKDGHEYLTF